MEAIALMLVFVFISEDSRRSLGIWWNSCEWTWLSRIYMALRSNKKCRKRSAYQGRKLVQSNRRSRKKTRRKRNSTYFFTLRRWSFCHSYMTKATTLSWLCTFIRTKCSCSSVDKASRSSLNSKCRHKPLCVFWCDWLWRNVS